MTPEHRAGCEFRVAGRTLSGVAMRYGDVSPDFRERFVPGAFGDVERIDVNLQHDCSLVVAHGAMLTDTERELRVRAELPVDSAALKLVRRGALNGFSVEFHARQERREGDVRVVERADLVGLALVDRGAYPQSTAEVRARSGRTMTAAIPTGRPVACECAGGGCSRSMLLQEAMEEMWGEVFEETTRRVVGAYFENYSKPLASTARGTLRGAIRGTGFRGREPIVEIDIPDSAAGRELLEAWDASGLVVRPFIRDIQGEVIDDVQHIVGGRLGAVIVSATDAREGWPDPVIGPTPAAVMEPRSAPRRRRLWL